MKNAVHMLRYSWCSVLLALLSGAVLRSAAGAQQSPASVQQAPAFSQQDSQFFESQIRPLLSEHCYECHSGESRILCGGLRLDHREGVLRGGNSGAAIVPGNPETSLLMQAVRY
ncbi:MAG: c-type cytochrome domain-containing protein, partial [Planctomycetaceae bacterium]